MTKRGTRGASGRAPWALLLLLPAAASLGCGYLGSARDFAPERLASEEGWTALSSVPVLRQTSPEGCGAAALAMVLAAWDAPLSPAELEALCPPSPGKGVSAGDLRRIASDRGFSAFLIEATFEDLTREIRRGRPVLVGLAKPYASGVLGHFEVVVGFHARGGLVLTLDPAHGWRENTVQGFLSEWLPAGCPALVVFRPDKT